jgi:CheY-like chemotaxis protein
MTEETTVLIVDDFEDNRTMYAEFFKFSGYAVVEAADGLEAIDKATSFAPDVVVMDLSLPLLDGWEATKRLKRDPRTQHIPVVVLSGHSLERHWRSAREAGCDGFLAKPCLPETLLETVRRVLTGRSLASCGPTRDDRLAIHAWDRADDDVPKH